MEEVPRRRRKRVDAPGEQPRREPAPRGEPTRELDPRETGQDELDELIERGEALREREEVPLRELGEERERPPKRRPPEDYYPEEGFDDYGVPVEENGGGGKGGGRFKMPQGPLGMVLTMLLVAILVTAVMTMYFGGYLGVATKNDIAGISDERIVNALAPVKASVNTLSNTALDLDDLLAYGYVTSSALSGLAKSSDLTGYVKTSTLTGRLDGLATDADLKIVRDEMDALEGLDEDIQDWVDAQLDYLRDEVAAVLLTANGTDTEARAQLSALTALFVALQEDVADLQPDDPDDPDDPGDGLSVDLGYSATLTFPGNSTELQGSVLFAVENNLNQDVENVLLELTIHSRGEPVEFSMPNITGGWPLQWTAVYAGSGCVVLEGAPYPYSSGLSVDAGDETNVHLNLVLKTTTPTPNVGTMLFIEVKIKSYDVVS